MTTEQWRKLSIGLAVVLFFMLGVSIAVLLSPGGSPTATSAPSQAIGSGRPSAGPTRAPSAAPSGQPTDEPTGEPTETPSLAPTQSPTSSLPPAGGLATRALFESIGLDQTGASGAVARRIVFKSDGKGKVVAKLVASAGGKTRICLQEGTRAPTCLTNTTATITGTPRAATSTTWTLTLIGAKGGTPTAQVQVDFPSRSPRLTMSGFVVKGTASAPYNGIAVEVTAAKKGPLRLTATFTSGGAASSQAWRWALTDLEPGTTPEFARTGSSASTFLSRNVAGPARYGVSIGSTAGDVSGSVRVSATLTWP